MSSQQIRVLQCEQCSVFQVDIVKKAKKFECKICGRKQLTRTEFLRGTGAECRRMVQELNMKRGQELEYGRSNEDDSAGEITPAEVKGFVGLNHLTQDCQTKNDNDDDDDDDDDVYIPKHKKFKDYEDIPATTSLGAREKHEPKKNEPSGQNLKNEGRSKWSEFL